MLNHKNLMYLLLVFLCGCASFHAPYRWLPVADKVPEDPYGGWIEVRYMHPDSIKVENLKGELIAVNSDTLYLLDYPLSTLRILPAANIKSARLVRYFANEGAVGALTFLGSVSTISNGWFLLFTLPGWIVGGSIAATARSFDPVMDFPEVSLRELSPYARFPQGLPKGVNIYRMGPKLPLQPVIAEKDTGKTN